MTTHLDQVIDALAASDPNYRPPDPRTRAAMQRVIDATVAHLSSSQARDVARVWLGAPA